MWNYKWNIFQKIDFIVQQIYGVLNRDNYTISNLKMGEMQSYNFESNAWTLKMMVNL